MLCWYLPQPPHCGESHIMIVPTTNLMLCSSLRFTTWLWRSLWTGGEQSLLLLQHRFIFSRFANAPDYDVVNTLWYCVSPTSLGSFYHCGTFQIDSLSKRTEKPFLLIFLLSPSVAMMEQMMGLVGGFSNQCFAFSSYCKPQFLPITGRTLL